MASAFTHAFAAAALGTAVLPGRPRLRLLVAGAACAVLPDLDVVGFGLGIDYGHWLGHRGFSHSLLFAACTGLLVTALFFRGDAWRPWRLRVALFLFAATASHGVFDALTDGGLGIAFLSPFDDTRYFLPWRPVAVSPIGVSEFFGARGLRVLASEAAWIALPWLVPLVAVRGIGRVRQWRADGLARERNG